MEKNNASKVKIVKMLQKPSTRQPYYKKRNKIKV